MKKIYVLLITALVLFTLSACKKKEPEPEVIVHDYYFQDYIDVKIFGADGYAIAKYYPKEFDVKDFKTEEDYIKVRKVMNNMIDKIAFTKNAGLTNGETIYYGTTKDFKLTEDIDICLDPVPITIEGLPEVKDVDIFGPNVATFYGLEGTNKVVYEFPKINDLPEEILNNLSYRISIDTSKVEANTTVLRMTAEISNELLRQYDCSSTEEFFVVKGYNVTTKGEKVLRNIVTPIVFSNNNKGAIRTKLNEALKVYLENKGVNYYEVASVQQSRYTSDPFIYKVGSIVRSRDEKVCSFVNLQMTELKETINVQEITGGTREAYDKCYSADEDIVIKVSWTQAEDLDIYEEPTDEDLDQLLEDFSNQLENAVNQ